MRPLEDVLVVSLEQAVPGPLCSRMLADMGARVIKVERPGEGELGHSHDSSLGPWSSIDLWANPGKESFTLNLKHPRALDILLPLIDRADVLIENLAPGTVETLGLTYDLVSKRNPRLIYCHVSGFGKDGPFKSEKAFDVIVQSEAGLIDITGTPEAPAKVGVAITDSCSALVSAVAVLGALHQAARTGTGQEIDVAQLDTTVSLLGNIPFRLWYLNDRAQRSGGRHALNSPSGVFEASDGRITFAVISNVMWQRFCELVGRPELIDDARFATLADRGFNRVALDQIVEAIIRRRSCAQWIADFDRIGIPCRKMRSLEEALDHPQIKYRGLIGEIPSQYGPAKVINLPAKFSGSFFQPKSAPPEVGEHTESVLRELGFGEAEIHKLKAEGVV